ncbi:glycoside hydrolase family 33 protein [Thermothelomyces thermophilus ATCC 42464]|uniref:exo-alpha-sialidase n=1 Tax=Thermothelomyces thermophilus (strain ATCC 42464 / BCRC 31852 / DSM 1799) TaxID=573729 RepID=G2QET1_THET4|nr:glycoside hydrolase family 33 protein [Thermothelomyces thermophilus ATCC 42464]AEO58960.1 glycoside hydrolase family 33 protein [Thermothelomyces thermophilus ATCC 42464]
MRWLQGIALWAALAPLSHANVPDPAKDATPYHEEFVLFRSANMASPDKLSSGVGFHSFRIPAVVRTNTGRILAFAEGRRHNNRDYGDINLVYKRTKTTTSHGASFSDWEPLKEVVGAGAGTWGNPTPVVDGDTIYLFMSWNGAQYSQNGGDTLPDGSKTKKIDSTWEGRRHLYLSKSTDDGATWSEPEDLTETLTPAGRAWDAVGPGIGIRLTTGELVVPAQQRNIIGRGPPGNRTWSVQSLPGAGSEGTIAQTPDGQLYRNDRPGSNSDYRRVARGNLTSFGAFADDTGLPDPGCEGSVLLYNLADDKGPARVVFMNSASKDSRRAMRVRISYDSDAAKFNFGRELGDAPVSGAGYEGGYSSMTKTADYKIGALVESDFYNDKGGEKSYRAIIWRRFNLSWILNGPRN